MRWEWEEGQTEGGGRRTKKQRGRSGHRKQKQPGENWPGRTVTGGAHALWWGRTGHSGTVISVLPLEAVSTLHCNPVLRLRRVCYVPKWLLLMVLWGRRGDAVLPARGRVVSEEAAASGVGLRRNWGSTLGAGAGAAAIVVRIRRGECCPLESLEGGRGSWTRPLADCGNLGIQKWMALGCGRLGQSGCPPPGGLQGRGCYYSEQERGPDGGQGMGAEVTLSHRCQVCVLISAHHTGVGLGMPARGAGEQLGLAPICRCLSVAPVACRERLAMGLLRNPASRKWEVPHQPPSSAVPPSGSFCPPARWAPVCSLPGCPSEEAFSNLP